MEIVFGIVLLLLFAVAIILVVLLQEGSQKNVGVITGGADTFLAQNKARSVDAFLARWTSSLQLVFLFFVIIMNAIMYFTGK